MHEDYLSWQLTSSLATERGEIRPEPSPSPESTYAISVASSHEGLSPHSLKFSEETEVGLYAYRRRQVGWISFIHQPTASRIMRELQFWKLHRSLEIGSLSPHRFDTGLGDGSGDLRIEQGCRCISCMHYNKGWYGYLSARPLSNLSTLRIAGDRLIGLPWQSHLYKHPVSYTSGYLILGTCI